MKAERRKFMIGGAMAAASMLIPLSGDVLAAQFSQSTQPPGDKGEINDWIWIGADGSITIGVSQCEVGQGIYTGLAEVAADEMDADWDTVTIRFVTGKDAYRQVAGGESLAQFVAASTSMTMFYPRMRLGGAQARDLMLRAGALYFRIPVAQCRTERSQVINTQNGEKIGYGQLLGLASTLKLNPKPALKTPQQQASGLIGRDMHRVDTVAKVEGKAIFGIDVQVPNMLIGVPWIVPPFSGTLIRIRNEAAIKQLPGIVALVPTRHQSINNMVGRDHDHRPNTVIVVAESYWQAKKAADLLDVEYDPGPQAELSSAAIDQANQAMLDNGQLITATHRGEVEQAMAAARNQPGAIYEAAYRAPYSNHASMEPCNATSYYQPDHIETWGPFQGQDAVRGALGSIFKVPAAQVTVNTTYIGGSFGRKYVPDAVIHATFASKAVGRPVKVIYPRDVDIRHGYFRPGEIAHYQATVDAQGYPQAVWLRCAGQSLFWQLHRQFVDKAGGWDETMVECVYDTVYDIPNLLVQSGIVDQVIAVSYMRGVGSVASLFFYESFISELAAKAGIDDYQYRRRLLQHAPEALKVLDATAAAADWDKPLPAGHYRGMVNNVWVGRNQAFVSYVALAIEIKYLDGKLSIIRATCGVDCGKVINPNLIRATMEGGIGFGITIAFKSQLHFEHGATVEANYDSYPLAKIQAMPDVKVVIVDSDRAPQGAGEISTAVVAPALASALHQATGRYFREIPFPPEFQPDVT